MNIALEPLDLAALLCSRVCHDVISPVGAIVNGLEVLESEKDPDMRTFATDLIRKSATTASAKLQFCRLAFGAAGSAGASIDTGDAENVTRGLLSDDKVKLAWDTPRVLLPKNQVKLILNMCLIAIAAIPRGGLITVTTGGEGATGEIRVEASGSHIRVAHGVARLLEGEHESGTVDAHAIQPYYTHLVARAMGMLVLVEVQADKAILVARAAAEVAPEPAETETPAEAETAA